MRHLLIAISGWAGTGKDECSGRLVKNHGAIHTGLADPGKRHGRDAYGFSAEQLWGPSKFRNAGDPRYPKPILKKFGFKNNNNGTWSLLVDGLNEQKVYEAGNGRPALMKAVLELDRTRMAQTVVIKNDDPEWFLSPREFLQLYMELCNTLYADTWIDKGIQDHKVLASGSHKYMKESGIVFDENLDGKLGRYKNTFITCFSDFRHIHEHRKARESADGTLVPVLIRIKRPLVPKAPFKHRSETEQTLIRDAAFDFIIDNSGSLQNLYDKLDEIIKTCIDPKWFGKAWSEEFVLSAETGTEIYQP